MLLKPNKAVQLNRLDHFVQMQHITRAMKNRMKIGKPKTKQPGENRRFLGSPLS